MLGSFSSKFTYGRSKAVVVATSNANLAFGSGGATWVSFSDNGPVNDGWALVNNYSSDDSSLFVNMPFTFYIYGTGSQILFIGSNTYLTLATGSSQYGGLSLGPNPAPTIAGIHLGSSDNSYQRVWYKSVSSTVFKVRYEGNGSTGGSLGNPGIVYEVTFYKSDGTYQYVQISLGKHNRLGGVFGITSGVVGSNYLSFATAGVTAAQYENYVIRTDATGNNPTIYSGVYTP